MDLQKAQAAIDAIMTMPGDAGIAARRNAAKSMLANLTGRFPEMGIPAVPLDHIDWPTQLMKFQQALRILSDIASTPADRRDAALQRDWKKIGDQGMANFKALCDVGQRLLEQCYRDIGGEVR